MMCMTILIGLRRAGMSVMTQPYWVGSSWAVEATFGMRTGTTTRHAFKRRARAFFAARRSTAVSYALPSIRLMKGCLKEQHSLPDCFNPNWLIVVPPAFFVCDSLASRYRLRCGQQGSTSSTMSRFSSRAEQAAQRAGRDFDHSMTHRVRVQPLAIPHDPYLHPVGTCPSLVQRPRLHIRKHLRRRARRGRRADLRLGRQGRERSGRLGRGQIGFGHGGRGGVL